MKPNLFLWDIQMVNIYRFNEMQLRGTCEGAAVRFGVKGQSAFRLHSQKGKTSAAYVKNQNIFVASKILTHLPVD